MQDFEKYMQLELSERQLHLNLTSPCIERGGYSTEFKGILSNYLDITIPRGHNVILCHRCNNSGCSNPEHLYFGTSSENMQDQMENGYSTVWERMVKKYGEEGAREIQGKGNKSKAGKGNKGKKKSFEHRLKIYSKIAGKDFDYVKVKIDNEGEEHFIEGFGGIESHSWDGKGVEPLKNITCPEEFDRALLEDRYIGIYVPSKEGRNGEANHGKSFSVKFLFPDGQERNIPMQIHGGIGMVNKRGIWKEHDVKLAINW